MHVSELKKIIREEYMKISSRKLKEASNYNLYEKLVYTTDAKIEMDNNAFLEYELLDNSSSLIDTFIYEPSSVQWIAECGGSSYFSLNVHVPNQNIIVYYKELDNIKEKTISLKNVECKLSSNNKIRDSYNISIELMSLSFYGRNEIIAEFDIQ